MGVLKLVKGADGRLDYRNKDVSAKPRENVLILDYIADMVLQRGRRKGESFKRNYVNLCNHIAAFSKAYETDIYTNSVNIDFVDDFIIYLESRQLKTNYIKMILGLMARAAKEAGSDGYMVDPSFKQVDYDGEDPFSIHLSMNEITRIYYFIGLTKKQQQIRDLFVIGCLTGLRHSDYSHLKKEDFRGGYIYKTTQKTKAKVMIPVHEYVREIYDRYDGDVAKGLSIQYFNRTIKGIVKKVGINKTITYDYTRGGNLITETKEKWEMISSHTARRSFATNMYLTGRMRTNEIMAITGHTTEKSFFRYIKIKQEDIANHVSTDCFFRI